MSLLLVDAMKSSNKSSSAARPAFKPSPKMLAHLKRLNRAIRRGEIKTGGAR